jgi:hypothetical protein
MLSPGAITVLCCHRTSLLSWLLEVHQQVAGALLLQACHPSATLLGLAVRILTVCSMLFQTQLPLALEPVAQSIYNY